MALLCKRDAPVALWNEEGGEGAAATVSGVNFKPLLLMSGGRIEIPMRLHSPTKTEIFSVLLISLLSKPAMNSTG